ncbi:hypothetical protein THAOC_28709, partial [Thalassiosira oceanica]
TSEDSARVRGEDLSTGGKAIVLKLREASDGDAGFALFVLSASRKLHAKSIRRELGTRGVRFATADELAELTGGLVPGSVPPFGRPILPDLAVRGHLDRDLGRGEDRVQLRKSDFEHSNGRGGLLEGGRARRDLFLLEGMMVWWAAKWLLWAGSVDQNSGADLETSNNNEGSPVASDDTEQMRRMQSQIERAEPNVLRSHWIEQGRNDEYADNMEEKIFMEGCLGGIKEDVGGAH